MSEMKEMNDYRKLIKLINLFQRVKQISWSAAQTTKRYPLPEEMTKGELQQMTKVYLALGFDLEEAYNEWKRVYEDTKKK